MRMLELFSGTGRMANAFKAKGWTTLTIDLFEPSDYRKDILTLQREEIVERLGGEPDFIWASPPCTAFSVASIGRNWEIIGGIPQPKTIEARLGITLLLKTLEILQQFPNAKFCIENPRGMMRTLPVLGKIRRETITYCQYGEQRMKPTDIWTNIDGWNPRPMCKRGMPCHDAAPRGAKTGTQGIKGARERGALPTQLCEEIAEVINNGYVV
jgi:hypothetical protein